MCSTLLRLNVNILEHHLAHIFQHTYSMRLKMQLMQMNQKFRKAKKNAICVRRPPAYSTCLQGRCNVQTLHICKNAHIWSTRRCGCRALKCEGGGQRLGASCQLFQHSADIISVLHVAAKARCRARKRHNESMHCIHLNFT